jgi:hypothetical protein
MAKTVDDAFLVHCMALSLTHNDSMINELDRIYRKAAIAHGVIELQHWNLPQETEKIIKTLGIACVQAGIRTGYLPNISLERYRYTSLISNENIEMKGAHQYVKTDPVFNTWSL